MKYLIIIISLFLLISCDSNLSNKDLFDISSQPSYKETIEFGFKRVVPVDIIMTEIVTDSVIIQFAYSHKLNLPTSKHWIFPVNKSLSLEKNVNLLLKKYDLLLAYPTCQNSDLEYGFNIRTKQNVILTGMISFEENSTVLTYNFPLFDLE